MRSVARLLLALVVALSGALLSALTTPAAADFATAPASSWAPNGTVWDVSRGAGAVFIAGDFTSLRNPATGTTESRQRVAAFDEVTGELLPWNPGANGTVRAIDVAGGVVYFGGAFTQAAGRPAENLAAVGTDGAPVAGWDTGANGTVWRILATADAVYVGGRFRRVDGLGRPRLARLVRATGEVDAGFDARVGGGRVMGLALSPDGTLYAGGSFSSLSGQDRSFVGAVDGATGAVTSWAPDARCDTCHVLDLVTEDDRVYGAVGGPGGRAVAWSTATGNVVWQRSGDGNAQALDVDSGVVYVGGHFGPTFDGQVRHQLVALQASNGGILGYRLPFTGPDYPGVWAVLADGSGLHLGGSFRFQGNPARNYARMRFIAAPPSAPRDVTADAVGSEVRVTWSAPADDGGGVDRYHVFVSPRGNFADERVCVTTTRSCTVPISATGLVEGQSYRFVVQALNSSGEGETSAPTAPVVADGVGPRTTIHRPRWQSLTATSGRLRWTATDASGVDGYRVAQRTGSVRRGFGDWTVTGSTAGGTTLTARPGRTVCVKVRAVDGLGNLGRWSGATCRSVPFDDRALRGRGTVGQLTGSAYFRGTATRLSGARSALRLRDVRVGDASVVLWSCPRCGKLGVYYGKRLVKRVELASTSGQRVVALPAPGRAGRRPMTITLRPMDRRKVVVDGVAVLPR